MVGVPGNETIGVEERNVTLTFAISDDLPSVTPADIQWYLDDSTQPITTSSDMRYTFSDDMLSLTIEQLTLTDEGLYALEATTQAGSGRGQIFLDVQGIWSCY